jgi:PAS domain S-box-containing protein
MDIWNMANNEPSLLASFPPHKIAPRITPFHHPVDPHDRMAFPLFMFDQPWIITSSAATPALSALPQALALLAGLLGTIVMTILVWFLTRRRMHLEDELHKSETRYHQLFETIHDGFALHEIICDKEGHAINYRFLQVNSAFEALTGLTAQQLVDHTVLDIMPDTEQYWIDIYGKVALTGQPTHFQNYSRVLNRWFEVTAYCPAIGQFTTVFHDITTQKKADDVKAQNARANQRLLDGLPYPAMLVRKDHAIITANRAAIAAGAKAGSFCWQGFLSQTTETGTAKHQAGHHGTAQDGPCAYCMAEEALESQTPVCKPGVAVGNRMYEIHWVPLDMDMYLHFVVDVTDRLIAENQIRESEKMRSIALLASGVAHEINNPISGIMGYAELTLDTVGADHPVAGFAREIIHETRRVADIVKNLLRFARQEENDQSTASVRDMIEGTLTLVRTLLRHSRVILEVDIHEKLPPIRCRIQQIQQVLMNLLTNARDALNEKYPEHHPDKKILITARPIEENAATWVRITIEDHGTGIPTEIQTRIFETFFTTKSRDKGTGLGLSISTDIIKGHHGRITFDSKPGQYSRFHIDLPADVSDEKSQ